MNFLIKKTKKDNNKFSLAITKIIATIVIVVIFITPFASFSQFIHSKYFPSSKNNLLFTKDVVFNPSQAINGTKIVAKLKQPVSRDHKKVEDDSLKNEDRIVSLRETYDGFKLYLELNDYDQRIEISAYNMLGKKIETFYEGQADKLVEYYFIPTNKLPNGVYLLNVYGEKITNGRLAKKFIVSR